MPEAFPCLIKRESAAIFLGVSCAVSVPSSAQVACSCVYSPAGVGGAEGRVGSWGCGGHLGVWWGRAAGRELRARGLLFPGTGDADRPGADTVVCGGVRHPGVLGDRRACGRVCHRDAAEDTV